MALKIDIQGMVWRYPEPYIVGHEQIRQYANAVKAYDPTSHSLEAAKAAGHDALIAPPTFMSIFAVMIQRHFFQHNDVGFETLQIVQVDQKFKFHRPIKAGDALIGTLYVLSVDERFGADIVTTRNTLVDQHDELVMESFTTLMGHEGDNSISAGWDPKTGQVTRKPVVHDESADGAENGEAAAQLDEPESIRAAD
ncbi:MULTISPECIES: (3R)-hydroxyacyl-ACP dehydratase subunit HadC [unclassified Mycobacterium]|uniref:(3R)-hydroxyacyl-ACP dehydratase subunit HadC n=1 Tax=unclassified Mycobacterium TaxID=2642494 RepID=UPI00074056E9|nr:MULTISPECIES: (3R)-hydroxyacyl-ACP dehydratase subunit HadC [unclassified Mycobacterium]KUH81451.1 3-hydroxyacyl-ACP dehydratase [Mycobacterium sp. GA-0227b]KUH83581.1 3-hydroxyacyl-ACP dehydratase [Mycobacterium sp. GA-1999]KUH84665.1 3-hydroxyacyl-ACP dehydratase [Mycobacterium sp. IS-1556]